MGSETENCEIAAKLFENMRMWFAFFVVWSRDNREISPVAIYRANTNLSPQR